LMTSATFNLPVHTSKVIDVHFVSKDINYTV
jgi:hypothetical protein